MQLQAITIGSARLIRGDCREVIPGLGLADAVLTDPPFFTPAVHYQARVEYQRTWADLSILSHWWADIAARLAGICGGTHCLVFCNADSFAAFYPAMFNHWRKTVALGWDKCHVGLGRIWRHQHELIIAARGKNAYHPTDGILRADVLRCKATRPASRVHPVEKPADMLAALIEAISPPGGIIVDPFMGSGTTREACALSGRRFIGVEFAPRYFDRACDRISAAQATQG